MKATDDIYIVLNKIGLNDEEIQKVTGKNRYLDTMLDVDIIKIIEYLYKNLRLTFKDIKNIVISNPWILNESFDRIDLLENIYKDIGIEGEKYRELLINFDRALSLNPKELYNKIECLMNKGYSKTDIGNKLIKSFYEFL